MWGLLTTIRAFYWKRIIWKQGLDPGRAPGPDQGRILRRPDHYGSTGGADATLEFDLDDAARLRH